MYPGPAPAIAWKPFLNDANVASARLRAFLPCRYLKEAGWRCEIFNPQAADSYELVIFQKAYDEESITLAQSLRTRGVKTVFDLCDNHFYNPEDLPALRERVERLRRMISLVDAVTVSTLELGKLIDGGCIVIDDAIEVPRSSAMRAAVEHLQDRLEDIRSSPPLRVVWYGGVGSENPPSGIIDLLRAFPYLEALNAQISIELAVISNSEEWFRKYARKVSFSTRYYEWKPESLPERRDVRGRDSF